MPRCLAERAVVTAPHQGNPGRRIVTDRGDLLLGPDGGGTSSSHALELTLESEPKGTVRVGLSLIPSIEGACHLRYWEKLMLNIKDPTSTDITTSRGIPQQDFLKATELVVQFVAPKPKASTSAYKLLSIIVKNAIDDKSETYTEIDVAYAYAKLYKLAESRKTQSEADRAYLLGVMDGKENQTRARKLAGAQRDQSKKSSDDLDKLESEQYVFIARGTDASQARKILTEETFGGLASNPDRTSAPTADDADKQTGFGDKGTEAGVIEEWSLGQLDGFATNGFMMLAAAEPVYVTLPPKGKRSAGERGVCGYADRRLAGVAIGGLGRAGEGIDPLVREVDGIVKADHRTLAALSALQESAARRVM